MSSKIRIKMGAIEVEYEGSEEFLKEELPELLHAVSKLHRESGEEKKEKNDGLDGNELATTGAIAAKLKSATGPDLILAAAAHLTFNIKNESFTRKTLLTAMKGAKSYYKSTYSKNLSNYLKTVQDDGKLVEQGTDTYALSATTRDTLKAQLDT